MRERNNTWLADRVKLLDDFAKEVAAGKWNKMPYPQWRTISRCGSPALLIVREKEKDFYRYKVTPVGISASDDNNFLYWFSISDKSFGEYLNLVFDSPALFYKVSEAEEMNTYTTNTGNDYSFTYNRNPYSTWDDRTYPTITNADLNSTYVYQKVLSENDVRSICKEVITDNEKKKETTKMDTSNLFNFDFGPASSNQFRMSPYGIAVRTQSNGWVAYNSKTGELFDVDIVNFDISKLIYKMPVALGAINPGDILMHSGKPVFVRSINVDGTVGVIDYSNATVSNILPVKSPFGFNFFTKVCALFNFDQASANADNPFGNMLPFLMLSGEKDGDFDPTLLFMASAMNGKGVDFTSNPMMMYFLMNRKDKSDILPFLMMMNGGVPGMTQTQSGIPGGQATT